MLFNALDYGITERDFWNMTPREVMNSIKSKRKVKELELQEKATFDYIQAQLIIKGVGIALGSKQNFPTIYEVYNGIFDNVIKEQEEKIQAQKNNVSAIRFKKFAQSFNNRLKNNKEVRKN